MLVHEGRCTRKTDILFHFKPYLYIIGIITFYETWYLFKIPCAMYSMFQELSTWRVLCLGDGLYGQLQLVNVVLYGMQLLIHVLTLTAF